MVSRLPPGAQRAGGAGDSEGSDEDIDERFERRVLKPLPVSRMPVDVSRWLVKIRMVMPSSRHIYSMSICGGGTKRSIKGTSMYSIRVHCHPSSFYHFFE